MKKLIFYLLLILHCSSYINNCVCQVVQEWEARYIGPYNSDVAWAMCLDSYGNVYATGRSRRSEYIEDYATVKFNKWGNLNWVARYNWPGDTMGGATAWSMAIDKNDNIYVTGIAPVTISGNPGKITTIKYDSSGVQKWVTIYYNELFQASSTGRVSIAVSNSFHIYVAGSAFFMNSGYNYTLIKYDSSGVQQWVARYHGPGTQVDAVNQPSSIALDSNENVYITGVSTGDTTYNDIATIKFDSSGTQKWVARYNGPANLGDSAVGIKVDNSGNVYVTGATCRKIYQFGARYDYITIKYDSSGSQKWASLYRGDTSSLSNNFSNSIAVDNQGNVYVTGESRKNNEYQDCATVKYDSSGTQKWVAFYNFDNNPDWGVALALDNQGYVYVAAKSYQGIRAHYATIKYSPTGEQMWCMRTYSVNGETPTSIAVDNLRNVYVSGAPSFLTIKYNQPVNIKPISNKIPDSYRLEQNFPNPFNPSTNIKYQIPRHGGSSTNNRFVTLKVYDILGREIETLVNEIQKPGEYEVSFNAGKLSSGIYVYRLIVGEYSETKRMILLK